MPPQFPSLVYIATCSRPPDAGLLIVFSNFDVDIQTYINSILTLQGMGSGVFFEGWPLKKTLIYSSIGKNQLAEATARVIRG